MQILIVHGWNSDSKDNWFPWLKSELESRGMNVQCPDMPNPKFPKQEEWLEKLTAVVDNDNPLILVGHSLGTIAVLRLLERISSKIVCVILVAGFTQGFGVNAISDFFKTPFDFARIKQKSRKFIVISSSNDPYLPITEGQKLADELNAEFIIEKNAGHLDSESGFSKYPSLLKLILELD